MTNCTVQEKKPNLSTLLVLFLTISAATCCLTVHHAMASEFAHPPYSNVYAAPLPLGGCYLGASWCDYYNQENGIMNLFDYPAWASGENLVSYVFWNENPMWGNSPTAYYPVSSSPLVNWGDTVDAVGTIQDKNWPFEGLVAVGAEILECNETSVNCVSDNYGYAGFAGVYLTQNDVIRVDYTHEPSQVHLYQSTDHLYVGLPLGLTWAYANNCNHSRYGEGYTDFGTNGNYLDVDSIYAFPE